MAQQNRLINAGRRRVAADRSTIRPSRLRAPLARLHAAGCDVRAIGSDYGPANCGVSMRLPVPQVIRDAARLAAVAADIGAAIGNAAPVTLTLSGLDAASRGSECAVDVYDEFCAALADALDAADIRQKPPIGLCLASAALPLRAFTLIAARYFGHGPRYALLTPRDMLDGSAGAGSGQCASGVLDYCWRYRTSRWAVQPAYGHTVSSRCALLSDEVAGAILPVYGLQIPVASAWLPIRLHIPRFADAGGAVSLAALDRALQECVDTGDVLLDALRWPANGMGRDVQANRRLALLVTGFGDLVKLRNADPADFKVLHSMLQLGRYIREKLWSRSADIARRSKLLPAIARGNPAPATADDAVAGMWSARWQNAVKRTAVRHRNLLVLSPGSVLPEDDANCAAFTDLLPVIALADACSFASDHAHRGWNSLEYKQFHQRASAVIERRHEPSIVATGV